MAEKAPARPEPLSGQAVCLSAIPIKKQAMNPFLPLWEYTPDGELHIFGDRIYLFGSHDTEGGDRYCSKGDYVGWYAPLDDLNGW